MELNGAFYCSRCMRKMEDDGVCPHCGLDNDRAENSAPALELYTLLDNRYQLGSVIGSGGSGITYAAWDEKLWIPVAVKEYYPAEWVTRDCSVTDEITVQQEFQRDYLIGKERFLRESRVLAMLQEIPGIVKVYDSFEENQTAYIVMEYVHGVTIDKYVREQGLQQGKILQMMRQPIDALAAVHKQGVLHRDITPNNMLVQEDGSVKLIDFGAAAQIGQQGDIVVLTQHYAAIEQYDRDNGRLGPWTDVYGVSATLYALLTGEEPQESVTRLQRDHLKDLDKQKTQMRKYQRKAIHNGLVVQPDRRTQSMEEFRSELYNLPMPEEVLRRRRFMHRVEAVGAVVVVLMLAVLINFTSGFPMGDSLMYSLRKDGLHIVSELNQREEREIPARRMGLPVSAVEANAFQGDSVLRVLTIPGSVQQIGSMAFNRCPALEQVKMEEGVRRIDDYAFAECGKLNTIDLPDSLEYFAANAFEGTSPQMTLWGHHGSVVESGLQGTDLNFAVREEYQIEHTEEGVALSACEDVRTVLVLPSVIDGEWVTALSEGLTLADTVEEVVLPDHLLRLDAGILSGKKSVKKVTLGSQTHILGDEALKESGVEQLIIPGYLEEIGDEALYRTMFNELVFPEGLKRVGRKAFGETAFESIVLPDGVEEIGKQAFTACVKITEIHLPEGISELEAGLFENCMRLENVYIPSTATTIRMYAFRGCRSMETLLIPENIDEIDAYAFAECTGLRYVAMPQKLEAANVYMFDGCSNEIVLAGNGDHAAKKLAEYKDYNFEDESVWNEQVVIGRDGDKAFAIGEIDEPEVVLPSYNRSTQTIITNVSSLADERNDVIQKITLPRYTTLVDTNAFTNLTELRAVVFPDTLQRIGSLTFAGCVNLEQIDLPESVEIIDNLAFMNCRSLTRLDLPDAVYNIEEGAFFGCENVDQIHIPTKMALLPDGIFGRTRIEQIVVPGNISKVRCAFFECEQLRTAELQEGVRSMWESFAGCSSLETVTIPSSLEIITKNTFAGCGALKDVTFYADEFTINEDPFVTALLMTAENEDGTLRVGEIQEIALPHEGKALEHLFSDCPEVTIHAHKGSFMERYAEQYGLKFEALEE